MRYKLSKEEEYIVICLREGMKVGICKIPVITVDYLYGQNKHLQQYTDEGRIEYRPCDSGLSENKEISKKLIYSLLKKKLIYKDWDSYHHVWYKLTDRGEDIHLTAEMLDVQDRLYKATKYGRMDKHIAEEKPYRKKRLDKYIYILKNLKKGTDCNILNELNEHPTWSTPDFINYIAPRLYKELFYMSPATTPKRGIYWFDECDMVFKEIILLFAINILGIRNSDKLLKEIYELVPKTHNPSQAYFPDPFSFHH